MTDLLAPSHLVINDITAHRSNRIAQDLNNPEWIRPADAPNVPMLLKPFVTEQPLPPRTRLYLHFRLAGHWQRGAILTKRKKRPGRSRAKSLRSILYRSQGAEQAVLLVD
jgi:hypothetical protein